MNDNIIEFPRTNNVFPSNLEESLEHVEEVRREYCDEVADDAVEAIFSVMSSYGIFVQPDEDSIKNIVFMEEAVKSLLYSIKKVPHSFQDIANEIITINGDAREELEKMIEKNT